MVPTDGATDGARLTDGATDGARLDLEESM